VKPHHSHDHARAAEIERLTPHRLRRTFGSHLKEGRLELVSKLLGHRSTEVRVQWAAGATGLEPATSA
jgi:integrase